MSTPWTPDWVPAGDDDVAVYQDARAEAERDLAGRNAAWSTQYSLDDGSGNVGFELRDRYSTTYWYASGNTAWLDDQVDRCFRSFPAQGYSTEVLYRWQASCFRPRAMSSNQRRRWETSCSSNRSGLYPV